MQEHLKSKEAYKQFYEEQALNHGNDHLTEDYIRIQFLLSQIRNSDKVVEVGCQSGGITKHIALNNKYSTISAIDISEGYVKKARTVCDNIKNIVFINESAEDCMHKIIKNGEHPGIIIAMEIVEHVIDPFMFLALCYASLSSLHGRLLLTVPDENYVDTLGEHNTVFTEEKLNNMLKDAGFKNVFIFHKEEWYFAICRKG